MRSENNPKQQVIGQGKMGLPATTPKWIRQLSDDEMADLMMVVLFSPTCCQAFECALDVLRESPNITDDQLREIYPYLAGMMYTLELIATACDHLENETRTLKNETHRDR